MKESGENTYWRFGVPFWGLLDPKRGGEKGRSGFRGFQWFMYEL